MSGSNAPKPTSQQLCDFSQPIPTNLSPVNVEKEKSVAADAPKLQQMKDRFNKLPLRDKIFSVSTEILLAQFNRAALIYHTINIIIVILSIVTYVVQSGPQYQLQADYPQFATIDIIVIAWFTFDYCLKFTLTRELRIAFFFQAFPFIDFLSIIPFYIQAAVADPQSVAFLSIFRLGRLAQLFVLMKLSRFARQVPVGIRSVINELFALSTAYASTIIFIVLSASALFFAEVLTVCQFDPTTRLFYYPDGSPTQFQGIPESMWWSIVTISTVGYGDFYPITGIGKFIAGVTALFGILVLAFPLSIVAVSFSNELKLDNSFQLMEDNHEATKRESQGNGTWYYEKDALALAIREVSDLEEISFQIHDGILDFQNQFRGLENKLVPIIVADQVNRRDHAFPDTLPQLVQSTIRRLVDPYPGMD